MPKDRSKELLEMGLKKVKEKQAWPNAAQLPDTTIRRHFGSVANYIIRLKKEYVDKFGKPEWDKTAHNPEEVMVANMLKTGKQLTIGEIADVIDRSPKTVERLLENLHEKGYNVNILENVGRVEIAKTLPSGGTQLVIDASQFAQKGKWYRFGGVSDTHLCSKFCREDALKALYDLYEEEGITEVYHGGNMIEGEAPFNKFEITHHGYDEQIKYFVENYPQRNGITTYFVTGDDHEGWLMRREGVDVGRRIEQEAKAFGREDLKYLSYMEADIELKAPKGSCIMRLMHAGGGSAYATSYAPQKIVESFQGGEKPAILLIGHYHKAEYTYTRNVHCVQLGSTKDQDIFMRKKRISSHVGGWLIDVHLSEDGAVNRFRPELISFFDKGYYQKWSR